MELEKIAADILLVEDEAPIRRLSTIFLESAGYKVSSVSNGEDALNVYDNSEHDLVILDLNLGGSSVSGEEVYNKILSDHPDAKILFSSGSAVGYFLDKGIRDYILKPYSRSEFLGKVEDILNR